MLGHETRGSLDVGHGVGHVRPGDHVIMNCAPMFLELDRRGKLDLGALVTTTYSIAQAPRALADLEAGKNAARRDRVRRLSP